MIDPSTIITAELLAGLGKCPFCGAGVDLTVPGEPWTQFKCKTIAHEECPSGIDRSELCKWEEPKLLRARVSSLEFKVERLKEAGSLALGYASKGDFKSADEVWIKAKESV